MQEKVENHFWSRDGLYLQYIQRFIIQFGDDSASDTSSDIDNADSDCDTDDWGTSDGVSSSD